MTTIDFTNIHLNEMDAVATDILKLATGRRIILLYGDLGAGKTTLTISLCKQLHVVSNVQSPTYPIINSYHTENGEIIYHIDCYRLKDIDEALDAGIEECLLSGAYCIIEWPQVLKPIWPENYVTVKMDGIDTLRQIQLCIF